MGLMGRMVFGMFLEITGRGRRSSQSIIFAGSFRKESDDSNVFIGVMFDRIGEAELTDIVFTDTRFSFTKRYLHRTDKIRYCFKKAGDGAWEGEWQGPACGYGLAKCDVLPIGDAAFQPLVLFDNQCFECGSLLDSDPGVFHWVRA